MKRNVLNFKIHSAPKLKNNHAQCVHGMMVNGKSEKKSSISSQNNLVQVRFLWTDWIKGKILTIYRTRQTSVDFRQGEWKVKVLILGKNLEFNSVFPIRGRILRVKMCTCGVPLCFTVAAYSRVHFSEMFSQKSLPCIWVWP